MIHATGYRLETGHNNKTHSSCSVAALLFNPWIGWHADSTQIINPMHGHADITPDQAKIIESLHLWWKAETQLYQSTWLMCVTENILYQEMNKCHLTQPASCASCRHLRISITIKQFSDMNFVFNIWWMQQDIVQGRHVHNNNTISLETGSTHPLACGELSWQYPAAFSHGLTQSLV